MVHEKYCFNLMVKQPLHEQSESEDDNTKTSHKLLETGRTGDSCASYLL